MVVNTLLYIYVCKIKYLLNIKYVDFKDGRHASQVREQLPLI